MGCMWRELVLSSYHVGARDRTQVVRCGKHLYQLATSLAVMNTSDLPSYSDVTSQFPYH